MTKSNIQEQLKKSIKDIIKTRIFLTEAPVDVWLRNRAKKEPTPVSKEEAEPIFKKFEKYKSYFTILDSTQYSFSELKFSVLSAEMLEEFRIKATSGKHIIQWFLTRIKEIPNLSWRSIQEDYLPLLKLYIKNTSILKPLEEYKSLSDLHYDIDSKKTTITKEASNEEKDVFYRENGWELAMPHTTEASCDLGAGTTWCTARKGEGEQNLFLNYVGMPSSRTVLFYVLKTDSDPIKNPWSKLSVGFINGEPAFNRGFGTETVNAANESLTEDKFFKLLGTPTAINFLEKMKERINQISGKHPASKEWEVLAQNPEKLKQKMDSFRKPELLEDFLRNILSVKTITPEVLSLLASNKDEYIRERVAANENTSTKTLQQLSTDDKYNVRLRVASNVKTSPQTLIELARDPREIVSTQLLSNNNTPAEALRIIINKHGIDDMQTSLALHPNAPVDTLAVLSNSSNAFVRASVAGNSNTDSITLDKLLIDKHSMVFQAARNNKNLSLDTLEKLALSKEWKMRKIAAGSQLINPNTLTRLSKDNIIDVLLSVARNSKTPYQTLLELSEHPDEEVRINVAYNKKASPDILKKLSDDNNKDVLVGVASNLNTPLEILNLLSSSPDKMTSNAAKLTIKELEKVVITESIVLNNLIKKLSRASNRL